MVSPTSVKPGATSTLTVTTTGPSGALAPLQRTRPSGPLYAGWILLPAFALAGAGSTGLRLRRRRWIVTTPAFVLLIGLLGLQIACSSGGGPSNPGTPAGTYTVNINATSGSASHSTSVNITVQ
jgi:hypothetical protein